MKPFYFTIRYKYNTLIKVVTTPRNIELKEADNTKLLDSRDSLVIYQLHSLGNCCKHRAKQYKN